MSECGPSFVEREAKGPVRITADVKLDGRMSGVKRQVDILVEGSFFGIAPGTMAIDCKCLKKKVDVKDVEAFLGMLEDLGVTAGMLITTVGYTDAAKRRAANVVQEVIPLVDMVLLEEATDWWLASAGGAGTYMGDYVDHEPYGDFWWVVSFAPESEPCEEEEGVVLWSSNEGGWDAQNLGPNLLAGLLAQHLLARNPSSSEKTGRASKSRPPRSTTGCLNSTGTTRGIRPGGRDRARLSGPGGRHQSTLLWPGLPVGDQRAVDRLEV